MNSYTPLDLDKFRINTTPTPQAPKSPIGWASFFVILLLASVFLTTLLYLSRSAQETNIRNIEAAQPTPVKKIYKLVAGTDATFPPMEYQNETKQIVGYDVELGQKIADEMHATIEFVNIPWDELFSALEQRKIDLIISSVTITDERKLKYNFSDPYLNAGQVLITKKTNIQIKSPQDLNGLKVGVQKGTTNEQEAAKYTSDSLVIRYDDFIDATKDLLDGKVDSIISDLPGAKGIISSNPELKIASDPFTTEYYGIVFRKDQTELTNRVNETLTSLRQKGILNNLKEKYLD